MSEPSECPAFERCGAPVCPLSGDTGAVWFPEERICIAKGAVARFPWIAIQRRLKSRLAGAESAFAFTRAMLERITRVSKGTRGLDPDGLGTDEEREAAWFERMGPRPEPRTLTEEQRARFCVRTGRLVGNPTTGATDKGSRPSEAPQSTDTATVTL
jgi:hypothetical protein